MPRAYLLAIKHPEPENLAFRPELPGACVVYVMPQPRGPAGEPEHRKIDKRHQTLRKVTRVTAT